MPVGVGGARRQGARSVLDFRGLELDVSTAIKLIVASYIAGYDEVKVLYRESDIDKAASVRKIIEFSILGFNVLEEGPGYMVFVSVVDHRSMEFRKALSRVARISGEMLEDVARGVGERDPSVLELVVERDQLVDKLYLYMARQITMAMNGMLEPGKLGVSTTAEVVHLFLAIKSMERVADHATIMSQRILGGWDAALEEASTLSPLIREVSGAYSESVDALLKADQSRASLIAPRIGGYRTMLESEATKALGRGESPLKFLIIDSLRRIVGYSLDILEAAIDISMVRKRSEYRG